MCRVKYICERWHFAVISDPPLHDWGFQSTKDTFRQDFQHFQYFFEKAESNAFVFSPHTSKDTFSPADNQLFINIFHEIDLITAQLPSPHRRDTSVVQVVTVLSKTSLYIILFFPIDDL